MSPARPADLFPISDRARRLRDQVEAFVAERILPAEAAFAAHAADPATRWTIPPLLETLKAEARAAAEATPEVEAAAAVGRKVLADVLS